MKKNFIYNFIYQILILILPLITMPYVSRVLGAEGIGTYSYTYSIAYYFMIIAMLGLNNYGNRKIAKVRDDKKKLSKEFCSIYSFQLVTSIIMVICYYMCIVLFENQYKEIAFIQIIYVISSVFDINWFFFGVEKFKLTITRNIVIRLLSLVLIFIFVKETSDLWKYTIILAGSTLLSNIILLPFLKKYIFFTKITRLEVLKHLKPCLIMFLPVIAVSIYNIMDKIMLGIMSSVEEVGYYENSLKIIAVPIAIITALGTVMLPRTSNMISNNQEAEVKELIKKTMPFIMFLALPMFFGLIAVGKEFSIMFFGNEFAKSGVLMQLLSINIIFLSWGNVIRTQYLIPKERDKEYVISAFLGAIVNFILNIILIPKYAAVGACIGTIFAELSVVLYQTWVIRKELPVKLYMGSSIKFIIKSLIMFVIITFVGTQIENSLIRIITQVMLGAFIYLSLNFRYIYFVLMKQV